MSGFDVRFTVEGVLHVRAESADDAEARAIDILESGHLDDADDREIESGTVRATGEKRDDNELVRVLLRSPRAVEFAS